MYLFDQKRNGKEVRDPRYNYAIASFLANELQLDEPIMRFYINQPAVIIGKHQNAFAEVNLNYLEKEQIYLVRRSSGGGSVYHDQGTLIYGFIGDNDHDSYQDFSRFTQPIVRALQRLGVKEAQFGGRNGSGGKMDNFQKLTKNALDELSQVFAKMNEEDVRLLLDSIEKTERIFLLGAGREGLSTREFAMRLMHLGKEAHWLWDDTTPEVRPGDLFICACGSADVSHENVICNNAKQAGANLLLITPSSEGYLLSIADIVIKVPSMAYKAVYHSEDDYVATNQTMGNQFEQALLIFFDVIVMMLKDELGLTNEDMEARHRNVE